VFVVRGVPGCLAIGDVGVGPCLQPCELPEFACRRTMCVLAVLGGALAVSSCSIAAGQRSPIWSLDRNFLRMAQLGFVELYSMDED